MEPVCAGAGALLLIVLRFSIGVTLEECARQRDWEIRWLLDLLLLGGCYAAIFFAFAERV